MCNWFQNKSPTHTFAVDWDTWHGNWVAPCYFNGAAPTGSHRWDNCLQRHLACEGLYTEHKICRKSLRSIWIDNCFCNRFINLGRPIFSLNHSGASAATVFTIFDNIRDRACAVLHSRWAGHPICGPSWIIAIWFSYCSVNPVRPQNCIYLQSDLSCL